MMRRGLCSGWRYETLICTCVYCEVKGKFPQWDDEIISFVPNLNFYFYFCLVVIVFINLIIVTEGGSLSKPTAGFCVASWSLAPLLPERGSLTADSKCCVLLLTLCQMLIDILGPQLCRDLTIREASVWQLWLAQICFLYFSASRRSMHFCIPTDI